MERSHEPIGFQLKRADKLIDAAFDRVLAGAGVSRREWQALKVIARNPVDQAGLTAALRPFWEADADDARAVVDRLTGRGWLARNADDSHELTPAGREARAALAVKVDGIRSMSAAGISAEDYRQMTGTLARLIANLERASG